MSNNIESEGKIRGEYDCGYNMQMLNDYDSPIDRRSQCHEM